MLSIELSYLALLSNYLNLIIVMLPVFLAMFLVSLLTLSGLAAISYLFPHNYPQK